jgi:uncharacterized protein YerC
MITINDIREISVLWGLDLDEYNDSVDVRITLNDGRKFWGQIFTIANIIAIMNKYRVTGEYNSDYFWACDMVIVTHLTQEIVTSVIHDLIEKGKFEYAFCFIGNESEDGYVIERLKMIDINDIRKIDVAMELNLNQYDNKVYDNNIDVITTINDERRFSAQIFTIANIIKLTNKYRVTGEHHPDYFWVRNMIIVSHLTREIVTKTIHDLIKKKCFEEAFCFISNGNEIKDKSVFEE